jgi:transcriptional regulator with XRE-family HTH domain
MISEHQILNIYAENVRYFRKKLKISQEELAFRSGLHSSFIGMVERAERNSTLVSLQKIAKALEVGYDDLLNERKMINQ